MTTKHKSDSIELDGKVFQLLHVFEERKTFSFFSGFPKNMYIELTQTPDQGWLWFAERRFGKRKCPKYIGSTRAEMCNRRSTLPIHRTKESAFERMRTSVNNFYKSPML